MSTDGSTFSTGEPGLTKLLELIHLGELQLPDFQRGWVWDDSHICSLIASVSKAFPIGSVMLLETGGKGIRLKARPVEGAPENTLRVTPKSLILDGQQRMTSLYLALRSGHPVPTRTEKGKDIKRYYYLDLRRCLDPDVDRQDAVVSVPEDKMIKTDFNRKIVLDLRAPEGEYAEELFPLRCLFGDGYYDWCQGYRKHQAYAPEMMTRLDAFEREVVQVFRQYRVPTIQLSRQTSKEAVCQVFEKVNTGGVSLTVFELVTATFAADDYNMREDWKRRKRKIHKHKALSGFSETDFLQSVTLLASFHRSQAGKGAVSCKRRDILNLSLDDYKAHADRIQRGLSEAAQILMREKIYDAGNLPYRTQIVPLAAICASLENDLHSVMVKDKIARWYWCGVLGELYGGATETRFGNDMVDVNRWVKGGDEPKTIRDASFSPTRLLTLQSRQSAAYKGVVALLMKEGSRDWITGDPIEVTEYFERAVDVHHVFPRKYCQDMKYEKRRWNSIVNKANLTARTNRILGSVAPSKYISKIEKNRSVARAHLDEMLESHAIPVELLRGDQFDAFIIARAIRLLVLIERAMGKVVSGRDSEDVRKAFGASLAAEKRKEESATP